MVRLSGSDAYAECLVPERYCMLITEIQYLQKLAAMQPRDKCSQAKPGLRHISEQRGTLYMTACISLPE